MGRIGIDARLLYYRDGGISTYIRQLISALTQSNRDNEYTIFYSRKDTNHVTDATESGVLWTPAHHRIERLALSVELAWRGLDIFHSPDFIPPYRAAKKHVISVHDLTFLHYPQYLTADSQRYYNKQIAGACQHADHILAVSKATKYDLINMLNVPESKITVQPHGVDERYRSMRYEETQSVVETLALPETYILHVGTWEPRKNIVGLLRGYKHLLTEYPDAPPVVLVGREGWLFEQTRTEIEELALGERVLWRDTVTDEQLPAVYNRAMLNVTVSHYEGFGMPALEGMACGTVPIVSNHSSLPEVVDDVGLLIEPDNPEHIADALAKGLNDSAWRNEQSEKAVARASQFTWERSADIARHTYTSLL
ncbi:MAG: glycosyltransferase family 1 protein [Chloroflexota bacterium]